jgi:hypothetical protein
MRRMGRIRRMGLAVALAAILGARALAQAQGIMPTNFTSVVGKDLTDTNPQAMELSRHIEWYWAASPKAAYYNFYFATNLLCLTNRVFYGSTRCCAMITSNCDYPMAFPEVTAVGSNGLESAPSL